MSREQAAVVPLSCPDAGVDAGRFWVLSDFCLGMRANGLTGGFVSETGEAAGFCGNSREGSTGRFVRVCRGRVGVGALPA